MGNTVSEYEAVHNLMLQQKTTRSQQASDQNKESSSAGFAKSGCVPNAFANRASFLPDKTTCILNMIKQRAHLNSGARALGYQSSSIQRIRSNKYHSKMMREFLSSWNINDLFALVEEYENLNTLKSFVQLSSQARQYASTCRNDLAKLIDSNLLADVQLVYETMSKNGQRVQMGAPIQCHKAILAARSEYFKHLFLKYKSTNSFYISSQADPNVTYEMFSHFIRYLYSNTHDPKILSSYYLNFLLSKFKCNRNFKEALNYLRFSDTHLSDSVLLFKNSNPQEQDVPVPLIYQCHKSVLCARSNFFSSYLKRKSANQTDLTSNTTSNVDTPVEKLDFNGATQIVLDTEIVNPKYGRILMDALYLDTIDLRNITNISTNFSQEKEAANGEDSACKSDSLKSSNVIADAMELYVIAGLLDVPVLAQGCEDIILRRMSQTSVVKVIAWASERHGSKYVYRQCIQFLVDEYSSFSQTENFLQLSQEVLMEVLQSDFVQASELQILKSVLRWAQYQIETRDPLVLESGLLDEYSSSQNSTGYEQSSSSNSVTYHRSVSSNDARHSSVVQESNTRDLIPTVASDFDMAAAAAASPDVNPSSTRMARKSTWRQKLSSHRNSRRRRGSLGTTGTGSSGRNSCSTTSVDSEVCKMDKLMLRVAGPLLTLVRVAHVIPKTSTTYCTALKKKLIAVPYISDAPANLHHSLENTCSGWIRSTNFGDYTKPRLFLPYFNEAKNALAERLSSGLSYDQLRFLKDYRSRVHNPIPDNLYMVDPRERSHSLTRTRSCPSVRHALNAATASSASAKLSSLVPIPDQEVLRKMIAREHELQNSTEVKHALSQTTTNKLAIQREIQKSVVREFGYPDDVIEVLQNPLDYYNLENLQFLAEDALENIMPNVLGFAQVSTPRASTQVSVASSKDKPRPISHIEPSFDRLVSPTKSTVAELTMMASAVTFSGTLQDAEQELVTPKYSSRTLPSNRSSRNRFFEAGNYMLNNPPNIVPVGGIPCDLIPTNSGNRPSQLPFADILQDINMIAAQHSDPAVEPPEAQFRVPEALFETPVGFSQQSQPLTAVAGVSGSDSQNMLSALSAKSCTSLNARSVNRSPFHLESIAAPAIPPRKPIKPELSNNPSSVPSNPINHNCEFRCFKHLPASGNDADGMSVAPPLPPRHSITTPQPLQHLDVTYTSESVSVISPGSSNSRELPPDLTLPSNVQSSSNHRRSLVCPNRLDLCKGTLNSNHS